VGKARGSIARAGTARAMGADLDDGSEGRLTVVSSGGLTG
jgi:hypothetical protein